MVSPLLGCGGYGAGPPRYSSRRQSSGRRARVVPRSRGQTWIAWAALPASRHVVGVWRRRGRRHSLSVSRLVVRRGWTLLGDACRTRGQQVPGEDQASFVSCAGTGRVDIRVHGTGRESSTAAAEIFTFG